MATFLDRLLGRPARALALLLPLGCTHAAPKPTPAPGPSALESVAAAVSTPAETPGSALPFRFAPEPQKPWGLRVQRHRTLPSPRGEGESLHFDSEENSRISASHQPDGKWVLREVLTSHTETRNGDPDEDPVLTALTGVEVALTLHPDGRFDQATDPATLVKQLAKNWPADHPEGGFTDMPPAELAKELERDWRLGSQVYLDGPIRTHETVYTLMNVNLPQLPGRYVVVTERFDEPAGKLATGVQHLFGRHDARYTAARAKLRPLMAELGIADTEILDEFHGTGSETVDLQSLMLVEGHLEGAGIYPLTTPRGTFPLKFETEEVSGAIPAPALPPPPRDPNHTAMLFRGR
jgi:hypothetical protein